MQFAFLARTPCFSVWARKWYWYFYDESIPWRCCTTTTIKFSLLFRHQCLIYNTKEFKNIKSSLIKKKHYLAALYLLTKQLKGVFSLQSVFQWACGLCNLSRAPTITACSLVFKDNSTRALRSQSNNSTYTSLWSGLQYTTFPVHDIPTRLNNSGNLDNKSLFLDILHRLIALMKKTFIQRRYRGLRYREWMTSKCDLVRLLDGWFTSL